MHLKNAFYSLAAVTLLAGGGCDEELGVKMPLDTVYYPAYLAVNPVHRDVAYFVNDNFDLQYTSGSIGVLDLSPLTATGDGKAKINTEGSLLIDSFGGTLALKNDGTRAIIPIRGSAAVLPLTISADGKTLSCKEEGRNCHEKAQKLLPEAFSMTQDPTYLDDFYSLTFVPGADGGDHLLIGTLAYTALLPLEWPAGTYEVKGGQGYYGGSGGIADLVWLDGRSLLLGASQYVEDRDSRLFVTPSVKAPYSFSYIDVFGQFAGSSINAIYPVDDHRVVLSNTFPHSLVMVDLDLKDRDRSRGSVIWSATLEGESADLVVYNHPQLGEIAFVSVMDTDVIEVFSLSNGVFLGRIYTAGGPFSMAIGQGGDGSEWLLVTEFYSHSVAIFDISAGAVNRFSLKQRIEDGTHEMAKRDN